MIQEVLSASIDALLITRRRSAIDPQTIILLGVGIYVVLMLVVGLLVAGKSASIGDFAVTGRSMGLTVCSISIVATWFGAGPMMGSAAAAYSGDALLVLRDPIVSGVSLVRCRCFDESTDS
jgi:hypothetical protein